MIYNSKVSASTLHIWLLLLLLYYSQW